MKIILDPGHGGANRANKGPTGYVEADGVLDIGLRLKKLLIDDGYEVIMTREKDMTLELYERSRIANKEGGDLLISLHTNAASSSSARGIEIWYTFNNEWKNIVHRNEAKRVATIIQKHLVQSTGLKDRGIKTKIVDNPTSPIHGLDYYAVIRRSNMPALIPEMGFHSNPIEEALLKKTEFRQKLAQALFDGIKEAYPLSGSGIPIISKTKTTVKQMQEWAKRKGANQLFIDLAPIFYNTSVATGVNPLVTYCQSAKETGYMKFGGVIDASYNNPCGLKTKDGGGNYDPNAHQRFKNWEEGIQAQVDHLALYAGAPGYPKIGTPDPRHFSFIKGTAPTVESLGGKWAPSKSYGTDIVKMIKEVENTTVEEIIEDDQLDIIKISLHGKLIETDGIYENGTNYIPVRFLEKLGYNIDWKDETVIIDYKEGK